MGRAAVVPGACAGFFRAAWAVKGAAPTRVRIKAHRHIFIFLSASSYSGVYWPSLAHPFRDLKDLYDMHASKQPAASTAQARKDNDTGLH